MPNENLAGRTIAGYRLLERVGEGGTAEVYRAQHPERGTCAFKVLRSRLASDPTMVWLHLPAEELIQRLTRRALARDEEPL